MSQSGPPPVPPPATSPACARHPGRAASVVCARCNRPICTDCMVQAPVGWQCPDCVKSGAKQSRQIQVRFDRTRTGVVGATNPTPTVIALIVINVIVFIASGEGRVSTLIRFGEVPSAVHAKHEYYRLFDSIFLHVSFVHILFNMITLLIVGPAVEVLLGRVRFLALYLIAGLGGAAGFYLVAPSNDIGVGASGAIFGLMGAYVVLASRRRLPTQQVIALIVLNLIIGFADTSIGWQAHIGGLIVGALVALLYDLAAKVRAQAQVVAVTVGLSAGVLAILALLVIGVAPGHLGLGG